MIDVSGSMRYTEAEPNEQFNKLTAVQGAVGALLRPAPGQDAPLSSFTFATFFDRDMQEVVHEAGSKNATRIIEQITLSSEDRPTALYDNMIWAVDKARGMGARHVVFLTDGQDETSDGNSGGYDGFRQLKQSASSEARMSYLNWQRNKREPQVAAIARKADVSVHTVGFGDPNAGLFQSAFTDCETLRRVSNSTSAAHACIDTTRLRAQSSNPVAFHTTLRNQLRTVLEKMSDIVKIDYTMKIGLNREALAVGNHSLRTVVDVGGEFLTADVDFYWDGTTLSNGRLRPVFLPEPGRQTSAELVVFPIAGVLAALLFVPSVTRRSAEKRIQSLRRSSVKIVPPGSTWIGQQCPHERDQWGTGYLLKPGDAVIVCPGCGRVYHVDCWIDGGHRCYVRACGETLVIQEEDLASLGKK